jgi:hypothetical protein
VLLGDHFVSRGPVAWFNDLLPFAQSRGIPLQYREFRGEPAEGELFHPAVRLADDRTTIREVWASLPPFRVLTMCDVIHSDATILAYAGMGQPAGARLPILGFRRFGPGKLLTASASPFWQWGFVTRGFGEDDSRYEAFVEGAISWLTVREDFDPLRIRPSREVFSRGEPVTFEGAAYDQGFRPIPGVTGTIELNLDGQSDRFEADLIEQKPGDLSAELSKLPPGKYQWRGSLEKDGVTLQEERGQLQIESFSLEEFDQRGDPATLMAVSKRSGGDYYTFGQFDEALAGIPVQSIAETLHREINLWGRPWLLAIFVVALGVEWLLRKINHLL